MMKFMNLDLQGILVDPLCPRCYVFNPVGLLNIFVLNARFPNWCEEGLDWVLISLWVVILSMAAPVDEAIIYSILVLWAIWQHRNKATFDNCLCPTGIPWS